MCYFFSKHFIIIITIILINAKRKIVVHMYMEQEYAKTFILNFHTFLSCKQKEKVPEAAQNIRGDVKKRSELSSKLLEEAHKLEMREGRQQVKTRMEKSPFNRINNQAAGRGGLSGNNLMQQMSRGGVCYQERRLLKNENERARNQGILFLVSLFTSCWV